MTKSEFRAKKEYFANECKSRNYLLREVEKFRSGSSSDKTLEEIESYENRINAVDKSIALIPDPTVRDMIKDLWVNRYSKTKTSLKHNVSENDIYYRINKELMNLFKDNAQFI